ncbi:MAG: hypothetical protein J0H23_11610 [Micrococcales bacterium]|nr:hypothetical protein [Micrococcales bacterium]
MTLTEVLPSLRRSLPDPLSIDSWPELTSVTTTDVVVCGISMVRLVELCGTPCVHTGAAVVPGTHGRPSPDADAAIVIVAVTAFCGPDQADGVFVDGCLDRVPAIWSETRLINRASTAHHRSIPVRFGGDDRQARANLPADLRPGDLLAVPCRGMVVLRDLRALVAPRPDSLGAGPNWLTELN